MKKQIQLKFSDTSFGTDEYGYIHRLYPIAGIDVDFEEVDVEEMSEKENLAYLRFLKAWLPVTTSARVCCDVVYLEEQDENNS